MEATTVLVAPGSMGIRARVRKALTAERGFSLAEMAIAIVVLAIIIGVVYMGAQEQIKRSKISASAQQLETVKGAMISYFAKYNGYPSDLAGTKSPGIVTFLPAAPASTYTYKCDPVGGVTLTLATPELAIANDIKTEWAKQLGTANVSVVTPGATGDIADVVAGLTGASITCATN